MYGWLLGFPCSSRCPIMSRAVSIAAAPRMNTTVRTRRSELHTAQPDVSSKLPFVPEAGGRQTRLGPSLPSLQRQRHTWAARVWKGCCCLPALREACCQGTHHVATPPNGKHQLLTILRKDGRFQAFHKFGAQRHSRHLEDPAASGFKSGAPDFWTFPDKTQGCGKLCTACCCRLRQSQPWGRGAR